MKNGKFRFSRQRQTVLEVVKLSHIHPTADWIYKQTREIIPNISLGTVYRNLNQLVESGQLSIIKDKSIIRYDGNMEDHDHFHCLECDSWIDVDALGQDVIQELTQGISFKVLTLNLEMTGICEDCLKNNAS